MRILVTGSTGFVGKNLKSALENIYPNSIIKYLDSTTDLRDYDVVDNIYKHFLPNLVINLAGKVGGILANKLFPVDFFHDNMLIGLNIYKASSKYSVDKLVSLMGGCSYPAKAKSPINENDMWNGYPQEESSAYSIAKKTYLTLAKAYKTQFNLNSIVLMPGNIYGPFDNFSLRDSHVIPAMIRKFYDANKSNIPVIFFGTGSPTRDFVYIQDVINAILQLIEIYDEQEPINISTGTSISIKDLATTIANLVGYSGDIIWDKTKPDGQQIKIFDVSKLNSLNIYCNTPIEVGLNKTINWFSDNYNTSNIRL